MIFAVGAGPQVVAVSSFDEEPPAVRSLPRVGALLDPDKAEFVIRHTSSAREDSTATKIAKIAVLGTSAGSSHFNASIMVIDKESSGVVFSYNVKKGDFQSAAESFAKHLKDHIAGKE